MANILVTGANGQLGSEIRELSSSDTETYFFTDRETLDITNKAKVKSFIEDNSIDTIINCAAYTAVDRAEEDQTSADVVNHQAVKNLAQIAKENNIKLIHVSTDYVFNGQNFRPYVETDPTDPQGVYGETKLAGEKALQATNPKNSIIIRTSWVYSSYGANFLKTMLRLGKERDELGVIFDQVGTPTYARDLAETILEILPKVANEQVEVYHYSNEGICSWYDFAKAIFELSNIKCNVKPIETKEYPTPATRPHYSLLNKAKIKREYSIAIPYWRESLVECLQIMGERQ
ncbi:MAG: dTDP-4-dehydrorhamnose reductase [Sulfurovum sp.]|nr:dTDP-4-dehydrorhamnose reductase [Sulfurovum sp.]MDD3498940.1 dTDP-4-dehydrorhamnose reductase [Sulfurovum sp.]